MKKEIAVWIKRLAWMFLGASITLAALTLTSCSALAEGVFDDPAPTYQEHIDRGDFGSPSERRAHRLIQETREKNAIVPFRRNPLCDGISIVAKQLAKQK